MGKNSKKENSKTTGVVKVYHSPKDRAGLYAVSTLGKVYELDWSRELPKLPSDARPVGQFELYSIKDQVFDKMLKGIKEVNKK